MNRLHPGEPKSVPVMGLEMAVDYGALGAGVDPGEIGRGRAFLCALLRALPRVVLGMDPARERTLLRDQRGLRRLRRAALRRREAGVDHADASALATLGGRTRSVVVLLRARRQEHEADDEGAGHHDPKTTRVQAVVDLAAAPLPRSGAGRRGGAAVQASPRRLAPDCTTSDGARAVISGGHMCSATVASGARTRSCDRASGHQAMTESFTGSERVAQASVVSRPPSKMRSSRWDSHPRGSLEEEENAISSAASPQCR